MIDDLVSGAINVAGEVASDEIHRRWGCKGCAFAIGVPALALFGILAACGVFDGSLWGA